MQPDETDETTIMFMRLEQERTNDNQDEWKAQYGFPHTCTCAEDAENGNTTEVPECYAEAAAAAFESLRMARQALLAIATSESSDAYALKAFAHEMYFGPSD